MHWQSIVTRHQPHLVVVDRGANATRRLVQAHQIAAAARRRGWGASVYDFSKVPLRRQLMIVSNCSILLASHGAALGLLAFLPGNGVSVELMPFGMRYAAAASCNACVNCRQLSCRLHTLPMRSFCRHDRLYLHACTARKAYYLSQL